MGSLEPKDRMKHDMRDGTGQLIETELASVIKDAYPKAQYHFLVVSKEAISNLTELTREHLPLLDHMLELANQIIEQQQHMQSSNFLIGFQIGALSNGLNMHVISDDFYSESMRRRKHWNSFHTELFLTYQAVYALLSFQGFIEPMPEDKAKQLQDATPFHCNQCDFNTESLVALKVHLLMHWQKRKCNLMIKDRVEEVIRILDESKLEVATIKEPVDVPKPVRKPETQLPSWRQSMGQQPAEGAPYPNHFEKHFQKASNKQSASAAQYRPGLHATPNYQQPEFRQWVPYGPRPNYGPRMNAQNPGFNPKPYIPNQPDQFQNQYISNTLTGNFNNQPPNGQHQPHFNPFRQSPNMEQFGQNRFPSPRPPYMQGPNSFGPGSATYPTKPRQNRPVFNPNPQHYQAQNMDNNTPENSTAVNMNHNKAIPSKYYSKGPNTAAGNNHAQKPTQADKSKPFKKEWP